MLIPRSSTLCVSKVPLQECCRRAAESASPRLRARFVLIMLISCTLEEHIKNSGKQLLSRRMLPGRRIELPNSFDYVTRGGRGRTFFGSDRTPLVGFPSEHRRSSCSVAFRQLAKRSLEIARWHLAAFSCPLPAYSE